MKEKLKKNIKLIGCVMLLTCCITAATTDACVNVNVANDTYTVDESGCVNY